MSGPQLMLMSAAAFAIMGSLVKVAGAAGIPVLQIILARAIVSLSISLVEARRAKVHPLGTHRWLLLARGLSGFGALTCVYYAMVTLPYAEATVLHYMHPIFTAVLAYFILSERPTEGTLACVLFSVGGLLVMMWPTLQADQGALPTLGVIAGLVAAAGSGLAYTIVRRLAPHEHPAVIVLYFPLVCVPATVLLGWQSFVWPEPAMWWVLLGVGLFTQVGQVTLTRAMQRDSASRNTSLSYVQIVFAAVLAVVFFDEALTLWTTAGAALIIGGAILNARWQALTGRAG